MTPVPMLRTSLMYPLRDGRSDVFIVRACGLNHLVLSSLIALDRPGRAATAVTAMPPYVPPIFGEVGQDKAHMHHGSRAAEIGGIIQKTDGTRPAHRSPGVCDLFPTANPMRIQCETNAK